MSSSRYEIVCNVKLVNKMCKVTKAIEKAQVVAPYQSCNEYE